MKKQNGFTLVETLVAVLILTLSIGALLTLAANGFYSVRYSRNQIVANNLVQESLEYLRNTRDTAIQQDSTNGWITWKDSLTNAGCFDSNGCTVNPYSPQNNPISACQFNCPFMTYFLDSNSAYSSGLYAYDNDANHDFAYPLGLHLGTSKYLTSFTRKIKAVNVGDDQVVITATMTWKDGLNSKSISQSSILTNWKP